MASPPRRAVRRQIALLWAGTLALCIAPAVLVATFEVAMAMGRQSGGALERRVAFILAAGAAGAWVLGLMVADRALGPTLDRLQSTLDAAAGLKLPHETEGFDLTPTHLTSAFGQLGARLADASGRLRAQVERLETQSAELLAAREEILRAERLATVGRLAAGVAHEIGNPLGALTGFVEVGKADPAQAAALLPSIGAEAARIDRTLRELMDFARPGKMELSAVRLEQALEAAAHLVRGHPRWRSMNLVTDISLELPPVLASEHHLVQVLVNLFLNAADACAGKGSIHVAARPAGGRAELSVADDGPGLPEGPEEQIFEPFFTTKGRGQGTGLGLAICRRLMESFGGTIRAERGEPGTVFRLSFQVAGAGLAAESP